MYSLLEQRRRYRENREQNLPLLGTATMPVDPLPLYWIGLKLERTSLPEMENLVKTLQKHCDADGIHRWLNAEELHVTLALPGRPGALDASYLLAQLQRVCSAFAPFTIDLGDLNCFPQVIFRETYAPDASLFRLHHALADAIPASLEPHYRYENFVPHMSLCYLRAQDDRIRECLENAPEVQARTMTVSSLVLVEANDVADMAEQPLAEVELGTGKTRLHS